MSSNPALFMASMGLPGFGQQPVQQPVQQQQKPQQHWSKNDYRWVWDQYWDKYFKPMMEGTGGGGGGDDAKGTDSSGPIYENRPSYSAPYARRYYGFVHFL